MVYQPKRKYEWWDGYKRSVSADVVGGVVEQLEEKYGQVTRENFLEASRPDDSPTHALFEFDDSVAAEKYRLDQSATIIRSLRVIYVNKDKEEINKIKGELDAFINRNQHIEEFASILEEAAIRVKERRNKDGKE